MKYASLSSYQIPEPIIQETVHRVLSTSLRKRELPRQKKQQYSEKLDEKHSTKRSPYDLASGEQERQLEHPQPRTNAITSLRQKISAPAVDKDFLKLTPQVHQQSPLGKQFSPSNMRQSLHFKFIPPVSQKTDKIVTPQEYVTVKAPNIQTIICTVH